MIEEEELVLLLEIVVTVVVVVVVIAVEVAVVVEVAVALADAVAVTVVEVAVTVVEVAVADIFSRYSRKDIFYDKTKEIIVFKNELLFKNKYIILLTNEWFLRKQNLSIEFSIERSLSAMDLLSNGKIWNYSVNMCLV